MGIDQRSLLIIVAAGCGLLMVVGAFFLLYRGIIKLEPSSGQQTELDVLTILKLKTNIAALVLFVLGLAFLILGFRNLSPELPHFYVAGQVIGLATNEVVTISVCGGPWPVPLVTGGSFNYQIKPDLDSYELHIGRVGRPLERSVGVFKKRSSSQASGYGYIPIGDDLVARIGEVRLEERALLATPTPIDLVTDRPAPSFSYVR